MSYLPSLIPYVTGDWTPQALGYLAGILDGEGTFIHNASGRGGVNKGIRVCMCDEPVIRWLEETFTGSVNIHPAKENRSTAWEWTLQRQADLSLVLRAVEPYLICKRRQAQVMLELLEHLAAKPVYERIAKTSERAARKETRRAWASRAQELREAIRDAR